MKRYQQTLSSFFIYLGRKKWLLFSSFLFTIIAQSLLLYLPILTGHALDQIVEGQVNMTAIGKILILIILLIIALVAGQWLIWKINQKISLYLVKEIRKAAFQKIQNLPIFFLDQHSHGDLLARNIGDVEQLGEGVLMTLSQLTSGITTILVTMYFMFTLNLKITLIVMLLTPLSLFVASFIAKKTFIYFQVQADEKGKQLGFINEILEHLKVVKACQREEQMIAEFQEYNSRYAKASLKSIFYSSTSNPATRFVNGIIYTLVGIYGGFMVLSGALTIGGLNAFLSYANQYTKPFNEISTVITELQNALASAERVFAFLNEAEAGYEKEDPDSPQKVLQVKEGQVTVSDLFFSYDETLFLKNINFQLLPGQKIALVGPTGCGKTTLMNLLLRFYNPQSGSILIDGQDIQEVSISSLRNSIGMVLQDTWIRNATILQNIQMAKPEADREEVIAAAKESYADYFIRQLPNGYDTVMEEGDGSLSEGQRQLISIARMMLKKPPILILDEATSSIDTRTEVKIQQALWKLMDQRTSLIVAHRLSTIVNSDLILVMKDGELIEQGTHEQLLKTEGFYRNMYYKLK